MKGTTHKKFAPIFTLGAAIVAIRAGYFDYDGLPDLVKIGIPPVFSTFTSMAPDADLHAFKPMYVITDKYPKKKHKGKYLVKKDGKVKEYTVPKGSMKYWAIFYKTIGATSHRCFKSHGPLLWIPIWLLIYILVYLSTTVISNYEHNLLSLLTGLAIFGLACGYISHLVGDQFTKSGLPILPGKDFSLMKTLLGKKGSNLTRASSKAYNAFFLFISIEVLFFIIDSDKALLVNKEAVMLIITWIPTIIKAIYEFLGLFQS